MEKSDFVQLQMMIDAAKFIMQSQYDKAEGRTKECLRRIEGLEKKIKRLEKQR